MPASVTDEVRRMLLPLRGSRPMRSLETQLLRSHYRGPARRARLLDLTHWLALYDFVKPPERRRSVDDLVELFFELVDVLDVSAFVEAGAKDGAASRRADALPGIDHVVAFEANPYTYRLFASDFENTGVDYRHRALCAEPGTVDFLVRLNAAGVPMADGRSSMLRRSDHATGYETVSVPAARLDDELADSDDPIAMWVDVEGATDAVLGGATQVLERTEVVVIEVEEVSAWDGQRWTRREVIAAMADHGLVPVSRDRQSRYQFNVVFVRADRLREPGVRAALRRHRRR